MGIVPGRRSSAMTQAHRLPGFLFWQKDRLIREDMRGNQNLSVVKQCGDRDDFFPEQQISHYQRIVWVWRWTG
jgi:hypothetical protein